MAKYYLDSQGVKIIVKAFTDGLATKADKTELADYATKTYVTEAIEDVSPQDLSGYLKAEDVQSITEAELNEILHSDNSQNNNDNSGT